MCHSQLTTVNWLLPLHYFGSNSSLGRTAKTPPSDPSTSMLLGERHNRIVVGSEDVIQREVINRSFCSVEILMSPVIGIWTKKSDYVIKCIFSGDIYDWKDNPGGKAFRKFKFFIYMFYCNAYWGLTEFRYRSHFFIWRFLHFSTIYWNFKNNERPVVYFLIIHILILSCERAGPHLRSRFSL